MNGEIRNGTEAGFKGAGAEAGMSAELFSETKPTRLFELCPKVVGGKLVCFVEHHKQFVASRTGE